MKCILTLALLVLALPAVAQSTPSTWYVRGDGGTRYTANRIANQLTGQCDGLADAPYPGTGINQHCAFNDYRFLWDDQATYGVKKWVIAGGDTVILDDKTQWRVGFDPNMPSYPQWDWGGQGQYLAVNPTIPAGTPEQHTRILGRNWQTCSANNVADRTRMSQIFGGLGVYTPLNLAGAQNVDVACTEITRHGNCYVGGLPAPAALTKCGPTDEYDSDGIEEDSATANVTLTDMWIHGHPGRGVKGPIGGTVTATRVTLGFNESAGWDFDDGKSTPMGAGSVWNFLYSTIEWSGCYQEYPIVHSYPATACYGQSNQGYGDGVGTAPGQWLSANVDHSIFRYNTQDGLDLGHVDGGNGSFSVTNSQSYGNNGAAFKWGWGFKTMLFQNNFAVANCERLRSPVGDTPAGFNANLGDFCRSGDALSFNFQDGATGKFDHDTMITYAPTTFDEKCVPLAGQTSCGSAVFSLTNNIVLAYADKPVLDYGGNTGPGWFCGNGCNDSTMPIGTINRDKNVYWGLRGACQANQQTSGAAAGTSTNESCVDPLFVNEPTFTTEASLDAFNTSLASGSPAAGLGYVGDAVVQAPTPTPTPPAPDPTAPPAPDWKALLTALITALQAIAGALPTP